jgi:hypothetical protein
VGFVTFVGGAIEYARLTATGLPSEEAIAIVPTQNLLVGGAKTLAVPVLLAALATTGLYVWNVLSNGQGATQNGGEAAQGALGQTKTKRMVAVVLVMLLVELGYLLLAYPGAGVVPLLVLLGFVVVTTVAVAHFSLATERFLLIGAATFVGIGSFLGALAYVKALEDKRVRPAAVLRVNDKAVIGFYIAQTSDRVYLGRLTLDPDGSGSFDDGRSRILVFRNDQVSDLSVGQLMDVGRARSLAGDLARELCHEQIARPERVDAKKPAEAPPAPMCWEGRKAGE